MTFADKIAARYSAVTASGSNATKWQQVEFCACQLFDDVAGNPYLGASARNTVETQLLVILDSLSSIFGTGNLEAIETAIELIRSTVYSALPSGSRERFDPTCIGTTTISSGVSIVFAYGGSAGAPYCQQAFAKFREACRRCLGVGGTTGAVNFTQSLPFPA